MEILRVTGSPYEDNKGEVLNIDVRLDVNEKIALGDKIKIEMMDGTFLERDVKLINPKLAGDYTAVSEKLKAEGLKQSKNPDKEVKGECCCTLVVMHVPYHEVKTEDEIALRKFEEEIQQRYCLTPYAELHMGEKSIYNYIDSSFSVPDKVIAYLQIKELYLFAPGVYKHPFIEDKDLLGPYIYSDGYYYWDRDTWKYVLKYGLTLPKQFIDYVMSEKSDEFMKKHHNSDWYLKTENMLNFLPEDAGDIPIENF